MNEGAIESELDWVLVLAPFRKDGDYIAAFLREQKIEVKAARVDGDLIPLLARSPGIIVITHEALNQHVVDTITEHLLEQPDWSEVPIVVLLERAAPIAKIRQRLQTAWPRSRLLFHSRPIAPLELINAIQSNLLVRLRQRQVRDSIEREKELRLELNHRVKNILTSVSSIFQMTRRGATTIDDLAADFAGRLQALSNVHSAVFEAGGEAVPLSAVIDLTVSPYTQSGDPRITANGPDLIISREVGTTIALCLHELITNAIKYGALSQPEGKVSVAWSVENCDEPTFFLRWTEADGPPVREPSRQGYGTRYVHSALRSLLGAAPVITFAPDGFRCVASGAMARLAPQN